MLNWSETLAIWQPVLDTLPRNCNILAVGERNGGLSLWLAMQGFHVVCTDRSGPTDEARKMHEYYKVSNNIKYSPLDVYNPALPPETFDLIIMKSVLGGLKSDYRDAATRNDKARSQAIDQLYSLLKPGGYLLSADNMKGSMLLQWMRKAGNKQAAWHYFTFTGLQQLLQPFSTCTIHSFGLFPTLFSIPVFNAIAHFMNKHLLQWLPKGTKYIGITVARK